MILTVIMIWVILMPAAWFLTRAGSLGFYRVPRARIAGFISGAPIFVGYYKIRKMTDSEPYYFAA
jgi:hypothetical protein